MSGLDLYLSQRDMALLFVYSACVGFVLGLLYDLFRFIRFLCDEIIPPLKRGSRRFFSAMPDFLLDLAFMTMTAISLILLSYYRNDGQFRATVLWGAAGGFFVFNQTVGRLTKKAAKALAVWLTSCVRVLFRLMLRPIVWFGKLIATGTCRLYRVTLGRLFEKRREDETQRVTRNLIESALRGFGIMENHKK